MPTLNISAGSSRFRVAEVVARIQANGDKGDVAGNVKQIASGRGTERDGAKAMAHPR